MFPDVIDEKGPCDILHLMYGLELIIALAKANFNIRGIAPPG